MKNRVLFPISVENFKMKAEPTTLLSYPKHKHPPTHTHTGTQWLWTAGGNQLDKHPRDSPVSGKAVKTMCATISTGILPQNNPSKNCSVLSLFLLLREAVPSRDWHGYGTGYNKNIKNFNTIAGVQLLSGAVLMSPGLCRDIQRKTEWSLSTGVRPVHYWFP